MKYKYKNKLKRFLKNFPNAILCQKKDNLAAAGMEKKTLKTINWKDDVYFYVNGGTKEKQVKAISSLYIDLDAGRDSDGIYLPYSEVIEKKKKMLERINQFPVEPSIIVETRNGYHLYWLVNEVKLKRVKLPKKTTTLRNGDMRAMEASLNKYTLFYNSNKNLTSSVMQKSTILFKDIERQICTFFSNVGADASTIKLNQIMRLPYSVWHKRYEGNIRPFFVKPIKEEYNTVYSIYEIHRKLFTFPIKSELFTYMSNTNRSVKKKKNKITIIDDSKNYYIPGDIPF